MVTAGPGALGGNEWIDYASTPVIQLLSRAGALELMHWRELINFTEENI